MADYYVENFNITTEEDEHYEAQVKDPEAVAMSEGELTDTVVSFEGAAGDSISSFTDFISNFVNGTKIGRWFKNFYAGCQYILHVGSLVNNCVTDNASLPLSAAQGKVLMDELTQVKSDLTEYVYEYTVHSNTTDYFCESYKYYDGRLIINQICFATVDITNTTSNICWGSYQFPDYPITFSSYPFYVVFAAPSGSNAWAWGSNRSRTNAATYVGRHNSTSEATLWLMCHAEGRWK